MPTRAATKRRPAPVQASAPSADLLNLMKTDDSQKPSEDKLDKIREKLRVARDMELEIEAFSLSIKERSEKLLAMKNKELVDLFDEARITRLGLPMEGNAPAYEIEIKPYYHANIGEEWEPERKAAAYAHLEKVGEGDMLRNTYTVSFGKGTRKIQKALESFMKKSKIPYSNKMGVPWNTLTAWLKNQVEDKKVTPPLELLGATVGRVASVVKQKQPKKDSK